MLHLIEGAFPFFALPFVISLICVPIAKRIGFALKVYAVENNRTVHHGKIVQMGGLAVFVAFMISMACFLKADSTINGILIGGSVVFLGGLLDDMINLSPLKKLLFEVAGALIAILVGGIGLTSITLPFGIEINMMPFSFLVSFIWIVGVTNAINLIDGLDGLSAGICFIVVCTIGFIGFFMGRRDIPVISLILAGSIAGFLPYNFHPASIFQGDCGALFLGFTLACLSLLGFKTTTFITLGFPVIILFVPISDTLIAMVRRKLSGKGIMQADRSHLHHILMYKLKLGHRNTVLVLYLVTALFGGTAVLSYFNEQWGMVMLVVLTIVAEIFVEATEMINPKWHPLLGLCRRLTGHPKKKALVEETDSGDASEVLTEAKSEAENAEADDQEDEDRLADAEPSVEEEPSDENEADSEENEALK